MNFKVYIPNKCSRLGSLHYTKEPTVSGLKPFAARLVYRRISPSARVGKYG